MKEVIIVEGRHDMEAVKRSVDAECIITGGYSITEKTWRDIAAAYERRGIIILTDPDSAGESIRRQITSRFAAAKQAFVSKQQATANGDIGIEQAQAEVIAQALVNARAESWETSNDFSVADLIAAGIMGGPSAAFRREQLGIILGLGKANAKIFLHRLNSYGVSRAEWEQALCQIKEEQQIVCDRLSPSRQ